MVRQAPNSFGYVELIYALQNKMAYGTVKNAAGKYIKATTGGVTAAASGAAKTMPADYRVSITNAPGATSYPISSFTWLLIPRQFADPAKGVAVKGFLTWMLEHGESEASGMGYAPLPVQVQTMVKRTITTIK
jgi:phosphate transport system substrate-binding protein